MGSPSVPAVDDVAGVCVEFRPHSKFAVLGFCGFWTRVRGPWRACETGDLLSPPLAVLPALLDLPEECWLEIRYQLVSPGTPGGVRYC